MKEPSNLPCEDKNQPLTVKDTLLSIGRLPERKDILAFRDICPVTGKSVMYTPGYQFRKSFRGKQFVCSILEDVSGRPKFHVEEFQSSSSKDFICEEGYSIHELWNRINRKLGGSPQEPVNGLELHGLMENETYERIMSLEEVENTCSSERYICKDENSDVSFRIPLSEKNSETTTSTFSKSRTKTVGASQPIPVNGENGSKSSVEGDFDITESLESSSNARKGSNSRKMNTRTKTNRKKPTGIATKSQTTNDNFNSKSGRKTKGKHNTQSTYTNSQQSSASFDHISESIGQSIEEDLCNGVSDESDISTCLPVVDEAHPLELQVQPLHHPGNIYCMSFNGDGSLLVSGSSTGSLCIWDVHQWTKVGELRDWKNFETEMTEYLTCCFSPNSRFIIGAGVTRDRFSWDENEDENSVIPGTIKIFDIVSGEVTCRLDGHLEEVFCMRIIERGGNYYLVSCGEDGRICKFQFHREEGKHMEVDFSKASLSSIISVEAMIHNTEMEEPICESFIAIHLEFLPKSNNRLFLVAVDSGLQLFDFDTETCIANQIFDSEEKEDNVYSWRLVTRGVEWMDNQGNIPRSNRCTLRSLSCVFSSDPIWSLDSVCEYEADDYHSNIWPCRLATQGNYIVSGSMDGYAFIWHLGTGTLVGKLRGFNIHKTVRLVLFHPTLPWLIVAGDDEYIHLWQQK
eukprot:jgi/Galph1/2796/GphlegSOOS_G1461.1